MKMQFDMTIDENTPPEAVELLAKLSNLFPEGGLRFDLGDDGQVRDAGGNIVGQWQADDDDTK